MTRVLALHRESMKKTMKPTINKIDTHLGVELRVVAMVIVTVIIVTEVTVTMVMVTVVIVTVEIVIVLSVTVGLGFPYVLTFSRSCLFMVLLSEKNLPSLII